MKVKKVLVTGANKGIGFGIAKHLGLSGWQVIIGARDKERAEKAIRELQALDIEVSGWVNIELTDLTGIEKAVEELEEKHPDLSLLVNNAGIPGDMSVDSLHTEIGVVRETLEVNFVGTFQLTKAMAPLLSRNGGRIVNVTVPSEVSPYWHPLAYVASKAAQNAMMGVMAIEFQQQAVPLEIFSVHPGPTTGKSHQGEFLELYPIVEEK